MDTRKKILLARLATSCVWQLSGSQGDIGNRPPVLCYHRVLPDFNEDENNPLYSILPETFDSQMSFLSREGFHSLSLPEYAEIAEGRRPAPPRSVLLTFDDGYADNYATAWQIAQKHKIQLNLFICTGNLGRSKPVIMTNDGYLPLNPRLKAGIRPEVLSHQQKYPHLWRPLSWQELGEMREAGVEIGFHSHGHRILARLEPGELAEDIARGLAVFEERLGFRPAFFAFPYGWYDSYNAAVISLLQQFGLKWIFGTHLGRARLPSRQPVFPRLLVYQADDLAAFQRKLFGAYDWLEQVRRVKYWLSALGRPGNEKRKSPSFA